MGSEVSTDASRAARRNDRSKRRTRRRAAAGAAALVLVLALVAGLVITAGGSTKNVVAPKHHLVAVTTTTLPPSTTAVVATSKVLVLQAFDQPAATGKVVTSLSAKTSYGLPRTLLVQAVQSGWLKVLLPMKPNDTTGWVRQSDVSTTTTDYSIKIQLGQHHLWLTKAGAPVLDTPVVIGAAATPTPTGVFYVTDPVDLRSQPNGPYGAFALGLSGYSNVLGSFDGGPPQIAVHGTPYPNQVGQDLSNGCVRIPSPVVVQIATVVPLGTPVTISA
jgi:lipoprotein-anchoring transpeptidase ErfK/SrfK